MFLFVLKSPSHPVKCLKCCMKVVLHPFTGEDDASVMSWIHNMENTAMALEWSPRQLFVYGKNNLEKTAKLAISGREDVRGWESLKAALKEEFFKEVSSRDIHAKLAGRRMEKDETLFSYFYTMKALSSRGGVTTGDLIKYVIAGINDTAYNKVVLYGCTDLPAFKEKLMVYQEIKDNARSSYREKVKDVRTSPLIKKEEKPTDQLSTDTEKRRGRCYQCGDKTHLKKDCTKGPKCFSCNEWGHIAPNCPKKKPPTVTAVREHGNPETLKKVIINGVENTALIDTGSDINLMSLDLLRVLKIKDVQPTTMRINGVGSPVYNGIHLKLRSP